MGGDGGQSEQPVPSCRILSTKRVFPATQAPPNSDKSSNLSIVDATVARFSSCAAIWLYDASPTSNDFDVLAGRLEKSLRSTLDDYRHFAGSLHWAPPDTRNAACPKYGRPVITWDAPNDPGMEFVLATYDAELSSLVPSDAERTSSKKVWIATEFQQDDFLPKCELAFVPHLFRFEGLPVASAQITQFSCGGWAVGVRITHCLSDAIALVNFVKIWAEHSRASLLQQGSGSLSSFENATTTNNPIVSRAEKPIFDPSLLDSHAGDITLSAQPDSDKVALARALPMHRFDWWAKDAPGYPSWATANSEATKPSDAELRNITLSPSTAPPWLDWDASKPIVHVQIRFSAAEVARLKEIAVQSTSTPSSSSSHSPSSSAGPTHIVSRLDALLAHLWTQINRARGLDGSDETVYLQLSLGLRSRVDPPLPDGFVGSPILNAHVAARAKDVCAAGVSSSSCDDVSSKNNNNNSNRSNSNLGEVVRRIRGTMAQFTPEAVGAYMHDAAYEVSPQRLWQAFLGWRFTLVTSWARAGVYGVDFGLNSGRPPRYVHARMPRMDGTLQVMDIGETGDFDISLALAEEDMRRLLAGDGGLWNF